VHYQVTTLGRCTWLCICATDLVVSVDL